MRTFLLLAANPIQSNAAGALLFFALPCIALPYTSNIQE